MKINLIIVLIISLLLVSCNDKSEQTTAVESDLIEITKAQFESENMVIGEPLYSPFSDKIYFTGSIVTSVDGQAQISLALPGQINRIFYKPGQNINKGAVMFEVTGNAFVDMQKDFAESSAIILRLKSDYNRTKELYEEQIATQKDFSVAESSYFAEFAKHNALRIKLENMGLDVSKIEKGEFYSCYTIKSPIQGVIASIDASIGQNVEPQQKIAEIIDTQSFQLQLFIFENNIAQLKTGQTVAFYLSGNKSVSYKATINAVGKTIMPDSKSVECYADIENFKRINAVNNQFVEGEIYTAVDSVLSVPDAAIVNSENGSYLLVYEKEIDSIYFFKKVKVGTGRKANDHTELIGQLPSNKLLINGVYNIQVE